MIVFNCHSKAVDRLAFRVDKLLYQQVGKGEVIGIRVVLVFREVAEDIRNIDVDETAVRNYFLDYRIKSAGNYRKTYRTQEQKETGVKLEIERINTLLENYTLVSGAIEKAKADDVDILWYADFNPGKTYEKKDVPYGIDLQKLNVASAANGGEKLFDYWYYWENAENENGSSDPVKKSDGLVMAVFNYGSDQFDLQFESLAVIADAIKTFSNYAA